MTTKSFIKTIGEKGLLADYNTEGKKLQTELTAGDAIDLTNNTISAKYGKGLEITTDNKLQLKVGEGLTLDNDTLEVTIKDLKTSITDFRDGDVILVDGPNGTAKMSKDDLMKVTAENALAGNIADFLKNRSDWTATTISTTGYEIPSDKRISSVSFKTNKNIVNKISSSNHYWLSKWSENGSWISTTIPMVGTATLDADTIYRITAYKDGSPVLTDADITDLIQSFSFERNFVNSENLDIEGIDGECIKGYPFAMHNILSDSDFWTATTISNSGVESNSTKRISSKMFEISEDTGKLIINKNVDVYYWVSKYDSDGNFIESIGITNQNHTLTNGFYRITARKAEDSDIDETQKEIILLSIDLRNAQMNGELIQYQSIPKDRMEKGAFVENGLSGKVLVNFGDSIANGAGANGGGAYAKYIASKNGMKLYSYALNGMVLAEGGVDTTSSRLSQQITSAISNIPVDDAPQFILFEGGTNDLHTNVVLGDVSTAKNAYGEYDVSGCDTDTYCGAFEVAVNRLRAQWPSASIIFVMVHEMTSRDIDKQHQLHEKQIALCNKWKIPFVDMFNEGQMTSLITATAQNFFPTSTSTPTGYDRTHPNELGYKKFYCPKIEAKMRETCGWDIQ